MNNRMKTKTGLTRIGVMALIASVIPFSPLQAGLIAYESFNYDNGNLSGQGSAQDRGWEAAWSVGAGDPPLVVERPMGYTNGTIRIDNFDRGGKALRARQITRDSHAARRFTLSDAPDVIYVSALFQVQTPAGSNTWWNQLWLNDVSTGPNASFISHAGGTLGVRINGPAQLTTWGNSALSNTRLGAVFSW